MIIWLTMAIGCVLLGMMAICCCGGCTIFTDDFSTDRTGTDYTIGSGSCTVSAGALSTGSTGFRIIENTSSPSGRGIAAITATIDTSGGSARLIGAYVDASNYVFGELTINGASSTLKLWKKVSGTDTQIGSTSTFTGSTGTAYSLQVCWDTSTACVSCTTIPAGISGSYTGSGNRAGFGASPNGGTVIFDDFTFSRSPTDAPTCLTGNVIECAGSGMFTNAVNSDTDWTCAPQSSIASTSNIGRFCLDRVNSVIYAGYGEAAFPNPTNTKIQKFTYPGGTITDVASTSYSIQAIDCDPTNQRLFYIQCDLSAGNFDLRKVNYDGTGDTSLLTWTGPTVNVAVQYDATLDRVYYVKTKTTSGFPAPEIRYVAPDGSGDTLISNPAGASPFSTFAMRSIAIDVQNRYLYWTEASAAAGDGADRVRRSDMSGGGQTTIYNTIDDGDAAYIYFCQKNEKLYVWDFKGAGNGKLLRMDGDGSNHVTLTGFGGLWLSSKAVFVLHSSLEEIGAGAIV